MGFPPRKISNYDYIDDILLSIVLLLLIFLSFGFVLIFDFREMPYDDHLLGREVNYIVRKTRYVPELLLLKP